MDSVESFDGAESMLRSWGSQSSLADMQRVPSQDSFDDECITAPFGTGKQGLSFKDYVLERNEPVEKGKPVIPAAVLAGFTGVFKSVPPTSPLEKKWTLSLLRPVVFKQRLYITFNTNIK